MLWFPQLSWTISTDIERSINAYHGRVGTEAFVSFMRTIE